MVNVTAEIHYYVCTTRNNFIKREKSVNNNVHSEKNVLLWFTNDATEVDTSKHSCKCSKKTLRSNRAPLTPYSEVTYGQVPLALSTQKCPQWFDLNVYTILFQCDMSYVAWQYCRLDS